MLSSYQCWFITQCGGCSSSGRHGDTRRGCCRRRWGGLHRCSNKRRQQIVQLLKEHSRYNNVVNKNVSISNVLHQRVGANNGIVSEVIHQSADK